MERISDPHEAWIAVQSRQPDASVSPGRSINSGRVGNRFVGPLPRGSARQEEDMPAGDQHGENAYVYPWHLRSTTWGDERLATWTEETASAKPTSPPRKAKATHSLPVVPTFMLALFLLHLLFFLFFFLSSLSFVPVKESPYLHLCSAFMQEIQYICTGSATRKPPAFNVPFSCWHTRVSGDNDSKTMAQALPGEDSNRGHGAACESPLGPLLPRTVRATVSSMLFSLSLSLFLICPSGPVSCMPTAPWSPGGSAGSGRR